MDRERAADKSNARGSRAEFLQSVYACGDNFGVVRQPEVVVRGKDDDFTVSLHLYPRCLRRSEVVQSLINAVDFELLDRRVQIRIEFRIQCHLASPVGSPTSHLPPPASRSTQSQTQPSPPPPT